MTALCEVDTILAVGHVLLCGIKGFASMKFLKHASTLPVTRTHASLAHAHFHPPIAGVPCRWLPHLG